MGHKSKKDYVFEESGTGDGEDDASFASRLLAGMGIEQNKHDKSEEAVEFADADSSTAHSRGSGSHDSEEVRHPHLHHLHESIHKVFHIHKSPSTGSTTQPSERASVVSETIDVDYDSANESSAASVSGKSAEAPHAAPADEPPAAQGAAGDGKKRNRRREKLQQRERERAKLVEEAEAEASSVPDKRAIELKGMGMMITKAGLVEFEVQPDGHCLFHSLSDQLAQRRQETVAAQTLRSQLADYIRQHPDDFVPYLIEDDSDEVVDIEKYTSDLENTAMWGGDCEIMAFSRIYEVPISVHFATHAPLVVNEEDYPNVECFHLAFYEQKFGLGAHYNSLRDAPKGSKAYQYREDDGWRQS